MTAVSPATALARSLQDKLGTVDLSDPTVLAAVDGVIGEIAAQYQSRVSGLEAEIARLEAVDRYRQAVAQASALLFDRPDLLSHVDLAAGLITRGIAPSAVRTAMEAMVARH